MFKSITAKLRGYSGSVEPSIPNPRKSDVYLVSYPKSGNTWMRYLLAHAIWPDINKPDLEEMARLIPSYGLEFDKRAMQDRGSPCNKLKHRIIKEHFPYKDVAKEYVKNVIYICRDGRDAIVSYWYFCNQVRGANISFYDFIRESAGHPHGPWNDHVMCWLNAPVRKLIIRYEDMLLQPVLALTMALDFVEVKRDDLIIHQAVEKSSFAAMKEIENSKGFKLEMLRNVDFVREGKAGTWKIYFDSNTLRLFKNYHGSGISKLGYEW